MKYKKILAFLLCVFICYTFIKLYKIKYSAEFIVDNNINYNIKYKDTIYKKIFFVQKPYYLIVFNYTDENELVYIKQNNYNDFLFPLEYFTFYSNEYDEGNDFIIKDQFIYLSDNFIYPTTDENEVNEVWMSLSSTDEDNIRDSTIVNHIVECAKSNGELSLDEDVYKQIKSTSWDNHCFYLKYKGYPLVEEFHIEETEDGRYIVDQYTEAEYDTVYLNDHK